MEAVNVLLAMCMSFIPASHSTYIRNGYSNNLYGVKTGFFWHHPEMVPSKNSLMQATVDNRTCTAVHVNIVSRHGARYTSVDQMRAFSTLHDKVKKHLGNQTYSFINTWTNNYPENQAELQTSLGAAEMVYLGERYGTQFHDLLMKANGLGVKFGATRTVRTQESAASFQRGLSSSIPEIDETSIKVEIRDSVLRFYDNCKRYEQETSENPEQIKFQNGQQFQTMIRDIESRLALNTTLTVDDVKNMYILCATELAVMDNPDWCTLQTDPHRELLEYENDLEDYNTRLYGHPVTGQMSCPLINDVFTELDNAIQGHGRGDNYTYGYFQFGHADTVIDFAAGLGLFKDADRLRADNFDEMKNRTFKSSTVDSFSTHLAFILYNCGGSNVDDYALRLLFNGKPLSIPKCSSDICWYKDVRLGYQQPIDHCDWHAICDVKHPVDPIVG